MEASIALHVHANRDAARHLTAADLAATLERLARNPREFDPPYRRALVERAAEMIQGENL